MTQTRIPNDVEKHERHGAKINGILINKRGTFAKKCNTEVLKRKYPLACSRQFTLLG